MLAVLALICCCSGPVLADDGYELWLDYGRAGAPPGWQPSAIVADPAPDPSALAAAVELQQALGELYGTGIPLAESGRDRAVIIGTPESSPVIAAAGLPLEGLGEEGYVVRSLEMRGERRVLVGANSGIGLVYGAFALLRELQTGGSLAALDLVSAPRTRLRLLNHWDNLDGTVERGYAGQSLWDWWRLPDFSDPRYVDYARANASLGINGTVLNNVNSNADILTPRFLAKVAALADVFRPWGLRVYLSARFSAPLEIGGLDTADPLEPAVRAWWADKTREIYALIPDFGGFLVKANSEGQPGPQDYGRSHADGANMLAAALAPHGGVVMWRAFVYAADNPEDRAKQAFDEFVPLDGAFADNVLVQVKNGPIDFQPREPFHPLFGAMPETPLMMEFQVTKEYLGFSTHLAYLAPLYQEVLEADTFARGKGSTVARVIDGSLHDYDITGIAGVSNIGDDRDWTGSIFNQADWFAFGRLAWDPGLDAAAIARDWLAMTFTRDPDFVEPALAMMMRSREAVVDYMTPLGLAHLMGTGHHYGPAPWVADLDRPEWNPVYYHRADREGIGFDRTQAGSNAVAQYADAVARRYASLERVPENLLLWFHHVPWSYRMSSGRTLWEELVARYDHGVEEVRAMQRTWASLRSFVDEARFAKTEQFLTIQLNEATWWRDACLAYFQAVNGLPFPEGTRQPERSLEEYEALEFPYAPGH